jgi:hypothetical protein
MVYSNSLSSPVQRESEPLKIEVLPSVMSKSEARQCVETIRSNSISIRLLVLELDERRGWQALGYSSMTACLVAEFPGESKTKLVRALEAARIERNQQVPIGTYLESQLRPLYRLAPNQWKPALDKAHQIADRKKLTAGHVAKAVTEIMTVHSPENESTRLSTRLCDSGDIVLIKPNTTNRQPYVQYKNCWAVVNKAYTHGAEVTIVGQVVYVPWSALKKVEPLDEAFRQIARRTTTLLERNDLDEMEREILQSYHKRLQLTNWQLKLLSTIEQLRYNADLMSSNCFVS